MKEVNKLTERIIGIAIEIHRELGPGLLESLYEDAFCIELEAARLVFDRQRPIPIFDKGHTLGQYRVDLIVEDQVVLELKSVERDDPVFEAQILTYLRVASKPIGLLINFNRRLLTQGIRRFILQSAR